MRAFRCPSCGSMLGKSDGTALEAPCHRCKSLKLAYSDLRAALRSTGRAVALVATGKT